MDGSLIILNLYDELTEEWRNVLASISRLSLITKEEYSEQNLSFVICGDNFDLDKLSEYHVLENQVKLIVIGFSLDRCQFLRFNGCLNVALDWIQKTYASFYLNSLLTASGSIHLSNIHGESFKEIVSLKVEERKDIGFYTDQIGNTAFKENFDLIKVRTYAMFALSYLSYTENSNITYFPLEVEMGKVGNSFCLQISCNSKAMYSEYLEQSFFIDGDSPLKLIFVEMLKYSDFLSIGFIRDGGKFVLTALWESSDGQLSLDSFSIFNISSFKNRDNDNDTEEYPLNINADEENVEKDLHEKIISPLNQDVLEEGKNGSYMDTLDDMTFNKSKNESESSQIISGDFNEEEDVFKIAGNKEGHFSHKLVSENKENPNLDSVLFSTSADIKREIEGWGKLKAGVILEHKKEIENADSLDDIDKIIKDAISEKISMPKADLLNIMDDIKAEIKDGKKSTLPERLSEESEIEKLKNDLNKRNRIMVEMKSIIDKLKSELNVARSQGTSNYLNEENPIIAKESDETEEIIQLKNKVKQLELLHDIDKTRQSNMNENLENYKNELQIADDYKTALLKKDAEINILNLKNNELKKNISRLEKTSKMVNQDTASSPTGSNSNQKTIQRLASQLNEAQISLTATTKKFKELEQKNKFLNGQLLTAAGAKDKGSANKGSSAKEKELLLKVKKLNSRATHLEDLARRFKEGFEKKKLEGVKLASENRKLKFQIKEYEESAAKKSA